MITSRSTTPHTKTPSLNVNHILGHCPIFCPCPGRLFTAYRSTYVFGTMSKSALAQYEVQKFSWHYLECAETTWSISLVSLGFAELLKGTRGVRKGNRITCNSPREACGILLSRHFLFNQRWKNEMTSTLSLRKRF